MSKSVSDSTLMKLWRKCVMKYYNYTCVICGKSHYVLSDASLQCHHVVHRNHRLLKFYTTNGVPVCDHPCHKKADMLEGREIVAKKILERVGEDEYKNYKYMEQFTYKGYLAQYGYTDNEYRLIEKEQLEWELEQLEAKDGL